MEWLQGTINTLYGQNCLLIWSGLASIYIAYYLFRVVKKPLIATKPNGDFYNFVEDYMSVLKEEFWPTVWCIESRAQTIVTSIVRNIFYPSVPYKREIFVLKDGGEVRLDTLDPDECSSTKGPTLILLPGITGSSEEAYCKGLALTAKSLGIRCVIFNQRGIGTQIKTPRSYCASNCDDLIEVIDHVKKKYKGSVLGAVSISMGGSILGKYLTTYGREKTPLSCAMIISVPWDVHLTTRSIETPFLNLLMNRHLASTLRSIIISMQHLLEPGKYVMEDILKSKTIRDIDTNYTVKQFGYRDVNSYYSDASLHDKIHKVTIPLFCLSSADDPFQPIDGIPIDVASKMDNMCIAVTSRGGHIGFMDGIFPVNINQYMFRVFGQYFKSMFFQGGISRFSRSVKHLE